MRMRLMMAAAAVASSCGVAAAQDSDSFRSPTGNIGCSYFEGFLRCDIGEVSNRLPRPPADCDLEWGQAFEMTSDGRAERICHGDTVLDRAAPVLGYGQTWRGGGFSCTSRETGMTCRNPAGSGWTLARAKQSIY